MIGPRRRRAPGRGLPARIGWATALALLVPLASASVASAGSRIPYGGAFREEIEAALFAPGPDDASLRRVSPTKAEAWRESVRRRQRFISEHVYNAERIDKGESHRDAVKKVATLDSIIALDHILDLLDRLEAARDLPRAYDIAVEILTVDYAMRSHTMALQSLEVPIHVKNFAFEWSLPPGTRARDAGREATNLVNPETGEFYTPDEIAALVRAGADLSKLDPPKESAFWRAKDDIASVDVIENYFSGGDPVHEGLPAVFPPFEGAELEFRKTHMTQTKPKIDVFWRDADCRTKKKSKQRKCRRKYKLKFGMETHADPIGNALLSALGFNVDVSAHLRTLRVDLGDTSFQEFQAEWAGYFDLQRLHVLIPLDTVVLEGDAGRGRDERGEYVVFREAVAEPRYGEIVRLGFFSFSHGIASVMREARSLHLFGVWIGNADTKDEENNKVSLRRDENGTWRTYLTEQDVGHALGMVLPERPNAFPWDVVEDSAFSRVLRRIRGRAELNYVNMQDSGLEETATWADAKWMTRLIAQLTREQIEDAVSLGHWPGGIGPLYVEKLINRRNQLVEVFGLQDEFAPLPVDRHITTADGSVVDGRLMQNRFPENSMRYDEHWRDLFGPVGGYLADGVRRVFQIGVGAVDQVNPKNIEIGGRFVVDPRLIVDISRQIDLNPNPQGLFDQYIVRDTLGLGLRVGVGYVVQAEGTWLGRLSLAYPMPTRRLAIRARNRTIDFLLPYEVRRGNLPEKYVLLREQSFGMGARLTPDATLASPFALGADIAANRVRTLRTVIDHRGDDPIVWSDRPKYLDTSIRGYLQLSVVQIPFLRGGTKSGVVDGQAWRIDGDRIADAEGDAGALFDRMVRRGQLDGVEGIASGPGLEAALDFSHRDWSVSAILAAAHYRRSEDRITLVDPLGGASRVEYRVERRRRTSWSFIDNGEVHAFRVSGFLGASGSGGAVVKADFFVEDRNTHSDEFDRYYAFLEGLGAGRPYLAGGFRASDWEVSGKPAGGWTQLLVKGRVLFSSDALERLQSLDEEGYWARLAHNFGATESEVQRLRARLEKGTPKQRMKERRAFADRRLRTAILRSRRIFSRLDDAKRARNEEERLRSLVDAIYVVGQRRGTTFEPTLMATLLEHAGIDELADRGDILVEARIGRTFDDENNLPERHDVVGRLGRADDFEPIDYSFFPFDAENNRPEHHEVAGRLGRANDFEPIDYSFFPFDAVDLYNMLNWVRETE